MKKLELSQGVVQYIFEPIEDLCYGSNVIVLIDSDKAILIDTGYEYQTEEVMKDLDRQGITIEGVIISHFHQAHMQGLSKLRGIPVYGSNYYMYTIEKGISAEEADLYRPTIPVDKSLKVDFGRHQLELIRNEGHTACTLLIKINQQFLYTADELIYSPEGELVLPRVTKNNLINHYVSVHNLKNLSNYVFVPGHGNAIYEQGKLLGDIKNVCRYLCEILSNDDRITYEQATAKCTCNFLHREQHEKLYQA